jgi:hypothetical protein
MYSRLIFASVASALLIPSFVSAAEVTVRPPTNPGRPVATTGALWVGYAASPNRRIFRSGAQREEGGARSSAKTECETTTLRTCSVISVPEGTDISAVGCGYNGRSESFVGGSTQDHQRQIALDKARVRNFPSSSCVEFYSE